MIARAEPLVFAALLVLLLPARAMAAATPAPSLGDDYYLRWLEEVSPLIVPAERAAFERLDDDERREEFIHRFWHSRGAAGNQARYEWALRVQEARAMYGTLGDDRARATLLLGRPTYRVSIGSSESTHPCGFLRPLDLLYYSTRDDGIRYLVFATSSSSTRSYVLWRPSRGLEPLLAVRRNAKHEEVLRLPPDEGLARILEALEALGCFEGRSALRGILLAAIGGAREPPVFGPARTAPLDLAWITAFEREPHASPATKTSPPIAISYLPSPGGVLVDLEIGLRLAADSFAGSDPQSVAVTADLFPRESRRSDSARLAQRYWIPRALADTDTSVHLASRVTPGVYTLVLHLYAGEARPQRLVREIEVPARPLRTAEAAGPEEEIGPGVVADTATPETSAARGSAGFDREPHAFKVRVRQVEDRAVTPGDAMLEVEVDPPIDGTVERVDLSAGVEPLATLTQAPWIYRGRVGAGDRTVVRAVAVLTDGRTAEGALVLGADHGEIVEVRMVELFVTVESGRRNTLDWSTTSLEVLEDGRPQVVAAVERASALPLSVAVMADGSSTMWEELELERQAALGFFRSVLVEGDRAAFIVFNHRGELVVPFTADLQWLEEGTAALRASGGTAIWNSLASTLSYCGGLEGQRAVILLSDGNDEGSTVSFEDVLELARRAGVTIYPIQIDDIAVDPTRRTDPRIARRAEAAARLRRLSNVSGGSFHAARSESDLTRILSRIEDDLRARYRVSYQSDAAAENDSFRTIEVRVPERGDLKVRTIPGYYPR